MDNAVYWIWLQRQLGFGSRAVDWVLEQPGTARYVYDMTEAELLACGAFLERRIPMLANKDLKDAADIYEQCRRLGYTLLTPDDNGYPARLRNIAGPPAVLYIQGELPDIDNEVCIGIVGTRNASEHGMEVGRELALRLTLAGAVIISGGAKGIDTAAHVGSVVAGGKTVSVLGCGIDYRYNMENRPLREQIAKKGALISEYPPGSAPLAKHFPIRNRIIAGLSLGVVVVEGSIRSGSVITADLATEQGRDVFAIPGKVGTINGQCSNRLIQQGAKAITSPYDVLCEYAPLYPHKLRLAGTDAPLLGDSSDDEPKAPERTVSEQLTQKPEIPHREAENASARQRGSDEISCAQDGGEVRGEGSPEKEISLEGLSPDAAALYSIITDRPVQVDVLAQQSGLDIGRVLSLLTELEIFGLVCSHPGQRFSR